MASLVQLQAVPFTRDACVGEEIPVRITLTVPGDAINAAQGTLQYDPSQLRIASVRTGGSIFRFWQTQPTVDAQRGTISFVGGLPTPGFTGSDGLLFTVNVVPLSANADVRMTWNTDAVVLLNDGEGTPTSVSLNSARMTVSDASAKLCVGARPTPTPIVDKVSPEPFDVLITRTEDAFRGQYFASYYAYDADSGIVRYEVRENGEEWHTQWSPYLLKTQEGRVLLEVKAIDAAGNQRISSATMDLVRGAAFDIGPWWFWLIALIAIVLAGWRLRRMMKKHQPSRPTDDKPKVVYEPGTTTP